MSRKPKQDDAAQSKRFIEAAREAEADESPKEFERAFKRVLPKKDERKASSR